MCAKINYEEKKKYGQANILQGDVKINFARRTNARSVYEFVYVCAFVCYALISLPRSPYN